MNGILTAKNARQLDICLKLLYSLKLEFIVEVDETNKKRIFYKVNVVCSPDKFEVVREQYRVLIS